MNEVRASRQMESYEQDNFVIQQLDQPGEQIIHTQYIQTKTFGSLDGLRAFAILAVVWHHYDKTNLSMPMAARGFLGVDFFFIISGFLIVTLLLRERARSGSIWLKGFYVRRFLRIFPPYYLMLFIVLGMALLRPGDNSSAVISDFPFAALYLSNLVAMNSMLAISWSLSAEEQFYMVVPMLEKYSYRFLSFILPVAYVVAVLPSFGFFPTLNLPDFFRATSFSPIILGALLAHFLNGPVGFSIVSRLLSSRLSSLFALVLMLALVNYPKADIAGWMRLAIHWSMLLFLAACVIREQHVLKPFLSCWPIRRIGIVSYGIYLYHHLAGYFVLKGLKIITIPYGMTPFLGTLLLAWFIAECSYRYVEKPCLAAKTKFSA